MYKTCIINVFSGTSKEKTFEFSKFLISIGSLNSDDIKLESSSGVLPNHITIRQEDNKFFFLNNCYSSVYINNKVTSEAELTDGDQIQFGLTGPKLVFKTDLADCNLVTPDGFETLKSPEEEFPGVKQSECFEALPFEKDTEHPEEDLIAPEKNSVVIEVQKSTNDIPLTEKTEEKDQNQITSELIKPEKTKSQSNISDNYSEKIEDNNGLTIKKAAYRKTTFGKNIDALKADVAPGGIEDKLKKSFEPKYTTRKEKYNEMVSILKEHNKINEDHTLENLDFKPKKRNTNLKPLQKRSNTPPPFAIYIFVAGVISAILFSFGISITNNGLSFFTLAPIAVALIAVDLINNSYDFSENRLTNSIFMAMGIVIFQTILVAIFSVLGSLWQLGQNDIISYFLNQIMFLSHQFVLCVILLFLVCIFTIIYMQKKFPENH